MQDQPPLSKGGRRSPIPHQRKAQRQRGHEPSAGAEILSSSSSRNKGGVLAVGTDIDMQAQERSSGARAGVGRRASASQQKTETPTHIPNFLERTFRMIEQGPADVVCWSRAGDSFIIKQVRIPERTPRRETRHGEDFPQHSERSFISLPFTSCAPCLCVPDICGLLGYLLEPHWSGYFFCRLTLDPVDWRLC